MITMLLFRLVFSKIHLIVSMSNVTLLDLKLKRPRLTGNEEIYTAISPCLNVGRQMRIWLLTKDRFYVVQESELKDNDWIRLYMELAFVTTNRKDDDNHKLSELEIVKVVVEARNKKLKGAINKLKGAINANIYIEYTQDLGESRRKYRTKIRRVFDVRTGLLNLVGDDQVLGLVGHDQELSPVGAQSVP
ncbi:UPF0725 protein At3g25080-like isoform X2 [Eutrema salsugineum]|nr:UPF0725 protein At3g25080-like isoform X2 [Eutrema salsugineum]